MMRKLKQIKDAPVKAPNKYTVLNDDLNRLAIKEVYPKLIEKLQIDLKRSGESVLRELISGTPEDLRLAGFIYAVASEDYERVKDEYETLMGTWATTAREKIAELKKAKRWEGGVYTADVERYVAAHFPEHKQARATLRKSKLLRDTARRLFEAYEARLSSLQSYGKLIQKRKGLSVEQMHGNSND